MSKLPNQIMDLKIKMYPRWGCRLSDLWFDWLIHIFFMELYSYIYLIFFLKMAMISYLTALINLFTGCGGFINLSEGQTSALSQINYVTGLTCTWLVKVCLYQSLNNTYLITYLTLLCEICWIFKRMGPFLIVL